MLRFLMLFTLPNICGNIEKKFQELLLEREKPIPKEEPKKTEDRKKKKGAKNAIVELSKITGLC